MYRRKICIGQTDWTFAVHLGHLKRVEPRHMIKIHHKKHHQKPQAAFPKTTGSCTLGLFRPISAFANESANENPASSLHRKEPEASKWKDGIKAQSPGIANQYGDAAKSNEYGKAKCHGSRTVVGHMKNMAQRHTGSQTSKERKQKGNLQ